jgi:hypothetical protein
MTPESGVEHRFLCTRLRKELVLARRFPSAAAGSECPGIRSMGAFSNSRKPATFPSGGFAERGFATRASPG